ncbi:unnamed protein product [Polarella glacialis]|uniref:BTB domain-containing protein n=1 Tax=Polarella glacialis TaxID=89957 RepID=A0A813HHR3_POLGL|nr:unnamed protein product [Polarella glacialis]
MVSSVARVAVELCQELVASGRREVSDLLKPARHFLDVGHDEQALLLAVQALVHAFRSIVHEKLKVNPICVPSTPRMSKASSGRGAWIARESLKIFREDSKDAGEAHALLLAAYVHVNNHDSTKALKAALASESCFRRFGDRLGEAAALSASTSARLLRGNAGISPQMQLVQDGPSKIKAIKERRDREIKAGLESGRAACAIYSELDEKGLEAMTLNQVAELFLAKDDPDEAKNVARESRDICQDLEDVRGEAQALNVILSANMLHEDDFVDALFAAKDVLRLFRGGNSKTGKEDKKVLVHLSWYGGVAEDRPGADALDRQLLDSQPDGGHWSMRAKKKNYQGRSCTPLDFRGAGRVLKKRHGEALPGTGRLGTAGADKPVNKNEGSSGPTQSPPVRHQFILVLACRLVHMAAAATESHLKHLSVGLHALLQEEVLTDVQFSVAGRKFSAHRVVLCAASSYFHNMLSSPFSESCMSASIEIVDVSPAVFEALLSFLYRGCIDGLSPSTASDILLAADKFCMEGLVAYCIAHILDGNLASKDCCGLLRMASEHGDFGHSPVWRPLHEGCMDYIRDHLAEVLNEGGGQAFLSLDKASFCAVFTEFMLSPAACRGYSLLSMWSLVKQLCEQNMGAGDLGSIYKSCPWSELEFLTGIEISMKLESVSSEWGIGAMRKSKEFDAGGFAVKLLVEIDHPQVEKRLISPIFTRFCSSPSPGCGGGSHRCFHTFPIDECPEAGYVNEGCATVKVTIKLDPLVGLCCAAAVLDFTAHAQNVFQVFDQEVFFDILQSDNLAMGHEDDLLDALVKFGGNVEQDDDAAFTKFEGAVATLRLEHVSFPKLVNAVRGSQALQRSPAFSVALDKFRAIKAALHGEGLLRVAVPRQQQEEQAAVHYRFRNDSRRGTNLLQQQEQEAAVQCYWTCRFKEGKENPGQALTHGLPTGVVEALIMSGRNEAMAPSPLLRFFFF